jgi:hypothetical protein
MVVTVRCTRSTDRFSAGELYSAEAVASDRGTVWVVQHDDDSQHDLPEARFRQHFVVVPTADDRRPSYGGFRHPYGDDALGELVEPFLPELAEVYRQERHGGPEAATLAALAELGRRLRDKTLLTGAEWERLHALMLGYDLEAHMDEAEAGWAVRELIGTEAPARALLERRDRPARVRKDGPRTVVEFGHEGSCTLQERQVALLRRLSEGRKVIIHDDGRVWSVRREASAYLFDAWDLRLHGRLDVRLL